MKSLKIKYVYRTIFEIALEGICPYDHEDSTFQFTNKQDLIFLHDNKAAKIGFLRKGDSHILLANFLRSVKI